MGINPSIWLNMENGDTTLISEGEWESVFINDIKPEFDLGVGRTKTDKKPKKKKKEKKEKKKADKKPDIGSIVELQKELSFLESFEQKLDKRIKKEIDQKVSRKIKNRISDQIRLKRKEQKKKIPKSYQATSRKERDLAVCFHDDIFDYVNGAEIVTCCSKCSRQKQWTTEEWVYYTKKERN